MGETLSNDEVIKMEFSYVTGKCANCGANNFHFDEKKQTFICDYCGAEVFSAEIADRHTKLFEETAVEKSNEQKDTDEDTNEVNQHYFSYIIRGIALASLCTFKDMFIKILNEELSLNGIMDTPINILIIGVFTLGIVNIILGVFRMLSVYVPVVDMSIDKNKDKDT